MRHAGQFYIGGQWVDPAGSERITAVDPATEEPFAIVAAGNATDIDRAVAAARAAFPAFADTSREERLRILQRLLDAYLARADDIAQVLSREMGAPYRFARDRHIPGPVRHFKKMIEVLQDFRFEEMRGSSLVIREPIGVCGLITPWNWPLVQIACKLAPAIAAGCTMVLKPSEITPLSAVIIAEVVSEVGLPPGVFNLVNGTGPVAGEALAAHPDVDMVSFTGSTRAGIRVAKVAADTVKRVHQELGGKSANILLPDIDIGRAVTTGVQVCFKNSGQSCNAPTRLLVPADRQEEAVAAAKRAAEAMRVGPAGDPNTDVGPVANAAQFERVQYYIQRGLDEGARLVTGGTGRPDGINRGYYVRPTIFADMRSDMAIAQDEIFGPVLGIQPYDDVEHAIAISNDSVYGLAAYVQSTDLEAARRVARRLRTGTVQLNYPAIDPGAPFGGYRQSGNGREYAEFGLAEFLEIKGVLGWDAA